MKESIPSGVHEPAIAGGAPADAGVPDASGWRPPHGNRVLIGLGRLVTVVLTAPLFAVVAAVLVVLAEGAFVIVLAAAALGTAFAALAWIVSGCTCDKPAAVIPASPAPVGTLDESRGGRRWT